MKVPLSLLFVVSALVSTAQSISSANLRHLYDPDFSNKFRMKVVRSADSIYAYFKADTSALTVTWERRDSYGQRVGDPIDASFSGTKERGRLGFPLPETPWLLVAILKDKRTMETRLDFRQIEANYPPDGIIWMNNMPVFDSYIPANSEVVITNNYGPRLKVFQYKQTFPAASPPFAEKELQVDPIMSVDSSFTITAGQPYRFEKEGMYLIQYDTNAARGISFRVTNSNYPRYTRVDELSSSLVFISTKEEADKLKEAGADKAKFDKIVLDIARDKDRAKSIIRNYFRRVELANIYFSSYKEGWKTDRGMMYLVFGLPDEVNRNGRYEVWTYRNLNLRFTFVKTGSVYDPDYFVLERSRRYSDTWYFTIDMWRKAQIQSAVRN